MADAVFFAVLAACATRFVAYQVGYRHGYAQGYTQGDSDGWFRCHDAIFRKECERRGWA